MKDLSRPLLATLAVLALMTAGLAMVIPADDSSATVTSGAAGPTATWSFDDVTKVMTISGTGVMNTLGYDDTFNTSKSIKSVVINNGITTVGVNWFKGCTTITSVTLPSTLTSIGNSAFNGCSALTSINIPASVTSIGQSAFQSCTSLSSVTLYPGLISIDSQAFFDCWALTSITLPDTLTTIENGAFYKCSALTSINIPASVTSIGLNPFRMCSSLTDFIVDPLSAYYAATGPMLFNADKTNLVAYPSATGAVSLPTGIVSIGEMAFYNNNYSLTSITIPEGVISIGKSAFQSCEALTTVMLPSTLTSIGDYAFHINHSITSIFIPNDVTSIGNSAFRTCPNLTSAYIPNYDSTNIAYNAFDATTTIIKDYPPISITSAQDNVSILAGSDFSYNVTTNILDATISVTGAPWLTATGNTISGIAGTPGDYNITVSASKTGYETTTQTFTITVVPDLEITSTQSDVSIITGTNFSYNVVTNYADATISVSGASWLNVSGHLIYGTVSEPGEYTITVSAYKDGYSVGSQTFTVTVSSGLVFISGPSAGYIVQSGGQ